MVKLSKRLFSLLTVMAICLSIVPISVFADDHSITKQPDAVIHINPETLEYDVGFNADFIPQTVEIYRKKSNTQYELYNTVHPALSSNVTLSIDSDADPTYMYYVKPHYAPSEGVMSEPFSLRADTLKIETQPESVISIDPVTLRSYVNFETNFVPKKVIVYRAKENAAGDVLSNNPIAEIVPDSKSISVPVEPQDPNDSFYGMYYYAMAFYSDDYGVATNRFSFSKNLLKVEKQPDQSIGVDTETLKCNVKFETSFTPVKVKIIHAKDNAVGDQLLYKVAATAYPDSCNISIPIDPDSQFDIYNGWYYYAEIYYTDDYWITTNHFVLSSSTLEFEYEPINDADGNVIYLDTDELEYCLHFKTNFIPKEVKLVHFNRDNDGYINQQRTESSYIPTKSEGDFNIPYDHEFWQSAQYGEYHIEAYYSDTLYITSAAFKLSSSSISFVQQPENSVFNLDQNTYNVEFETSFAPTELWLVRKNGTEKKIVAGVAKSENGYAKHTAVGFAKRDSNPPGPGYYIRAYYDGGVNEGGRYIDSSEFSLIDNIPAFTIEPEDADFITGQAQAPTITWDINFEPVEFGIVKVNEDGTEESPAWYVDPLPIIKSKQPSSLGIGKYRLAAKYSEDAEPVLSRIFTIREFKFNHDPSENDYDLEANYNETCYFTWDLSSKALKQQVIYKPVNSSEPAASIDIKNTAYIYGDIYGYGCEIDSSNKWEDYECFIRAWAKGYEDKYIDSDKFIIHMKGRGVSIEPNGGTYSLAMNDGVPSKEFVDHIEVNENGKAVMPECIMTPPAGTMFDCWVVTDEKAYFYTLEKARENGFSIIYDSNLHDSEYGFNFSEFYPGEEVDEELLQWNVVFPLWKVKSYSYSDCNFDKQYDGEPARICINELITPYIPAEYFTFYYDENGELQNKLKPDMEVKLYERNGAGMTLLSENLTMEYDASVPGGVRFIYETSADVGTYSVEFIYKGNRVLLYDVSITEDTTVTYTKVEAKEPTYTEEGNTEYYIGSDGLYYVLEDDEYIVIGEGSWIIPMLVDEHAGMLPVDEYKANGTYPTQEGKVFAGWFADSEYTTPYMQTTGYAYAKFINEKCITVKWQKRLDNPDPNKTDIRLVSTLDCGDYDSLHFVLTFTDNGFVIKDGQITRLYDSLDGFVNGENVSYTPDIFCEDSKYFAAYTITGMPNSLYDTSLTAQVYIITLDGTRVEGTPLTFKVADDQSNN